MTYMTLPLFAALADWLSGIAALPGVQAGPRHILVAYDRSEHSEAAFDDALALTELSKAHLSVLSVAPPLEPADNVDTVDRTPLSQAAGCQCDAALMRLRHGASLRGVDIDTHVSVGSPAQQILQFAASSGIDLIVVGHRGRSGFHERCLGSTSRSVVDDATCAVLVVKAR
jgi:nucleotide-binding universal stress UspA family protein